MALTNHERVGKALDLMRDGLKPFVERELKSQYQQNWFEETKRTLTQQQLRLNKKGDEPEWDVALLLLVLWNQWNGVFSNVLGHAERSLVSELREIRNKWAHQRTFSTDDAYRALDSSSRLLTAISAPEAAEVEKIKMELLRVRLLRAFRKRRTQAFREWWKPGFCTQELVRCAYSAPTNSQWTGILQQMIGSRYGRLLTI